MFWSVRSFPIASTLAIQLIFILFLVPGFEQMKKETSKYHNVFYEEKDVCNKGRARYQLDLAPVKKFPVSLDFAAAVCVLPEQYDEKAYFNFIERWGTVSVLNLFVCMEVS